MRSGHSALCKDAKRDHEEQISLRALEAACHLFLGILEFKYDHAEHSSVQ